MASKISRKAKLHIELDSAVRPQDDFFQYANGPWLAKNPMPDTESRWGSFTYLRYQTERQLHTILKELDALKRVAPGSPEQMIRDFYRSGMNMKLRNELGIKPFQKWLTRIDKMKDSEKLKVIAELHVLGVGAFWDFSVDQDAKNVDRYVLYLGQSGLGMPDRDYYIKDEPEFIRVREAYKVHIKNIFKLLGKTATETDDVVEKIMTIETRLARASMAKEDAREIEKIYHKKTIAQLEKHTPKLGWKSYLQTIGAKEAKDAILMQPDFFTEVHKILESIEIQDLKIYLTWHLVGELSNVLSDAFIKENFNYSVALTGQKKMKPLWRRVLSVVNANLDEVLGQIYVKRHFPPEAKAKMNELVDDLFTAYEKRIKELDWMGPQTKKFALKKLAKMSRKIGYPDKWKSYKGLVIKEDDYVGNILRIDAYEHRREMRKLTKPVDRKEWFMSPQTVNAYCNPLMNEIVFPAAILQPPFFDYNGDDALNYGAIGMTIGHEITHNFDDEGSKFDERGNLKMWWKPEDRKKFDAKSKMLVEQYGGYTVADGIRVNGRLTLGENIADLGGASIAYDAFKLFQQRHHLGTVDGLTPEQRFFIGFAHFECEAVRPEYEKMVATIDPHSPPRYRINGTLTNLPEFYEAFGVKNGDKLYREKKNIAKIW